MPTDQGDPEWYPIVLHMARSLVIPRDLWEDAVSEGCIQAIVASRSFDPAKGVPYRAWVGLKVRYAIRNFLIREREKWSGHVGEIPETTPDREWNPWDTAAEDWMDAKALLAAIPSKTAAVMAMSLFGYRSADISRQCRVSGPQIAEIRKGFTELARAE